MDEERLIAPLDWTWSPQQVLHRWPREVPLVMLCSGDEHPRWGRWSIMARPIGFITGLDAVESISAEVASIAENGPACNVPFVGGWIGGLSYDLGRVFEPAAGSCKAGPGASWPLAAFACCPDALLFDHVARRWWRIGRPQEVEEAIASRIAHAEACPTDADASGRIVAPLRPATSDEDHIAAISRTIRHIQAGDIFQANITRPYACEVSGSSRALFAAAMTASRARYGGYLELPGDRRVISMSPELFLQVDAGTRRIVTRPVKGTRPGDQEQIALWESEKDAAELHMIVDLMRNDLGRVCRFGSIRVETPRRIESHPTVHHGVGEISGRLRDDVSVADLLRATFPAGSITGAPKIRAMQIIESLESQPRRWYCGSLGFIDRRGNTTLSVGIRTMMLERGGRGVPPLVARNPQARAVPEGPRSETWAITYGAGGGIVSDSVPEDELRECDQKTQVLHRTLAQYAAPSVPATPQHDALEITPIS